MSSKSQAQVLVVDDDPDFLSLLIKELRHIPDIHVTVARNPDEAIRLLTRNKYRLIVSDWAISSSTAPELLTEVDHLIEKREKEPIDPVPYGDKVPVMFISGSDKVGQTQRLTSLKHFEPVSFLLKRCGAPLIKLLAENILARFYFSWPVVQPC
jgi:CheY-like chemotaxis protein